MLSLTIYIILWMLIVMNPGFISCHYVLEKNFITCVTVEKLQTSFKTGLLVGICKSFRTHLAQTFAKSSSSTIFAALPWLIPRHSAMSSIVNLQLSWISSLALALFPKLIADDNLTHLCLLLFTQTLIFFTFNP